ncbi:MULTISPECIES: fimbrial protein [Providencia]|uniref:Putative minor fimbrial subunit StfF n=1 Tax=Providencia rettgeri TaxID=587 RepID=A0A379FWN8_PRORE|nr:MULTISPECIES: fimbrial protein [Providencia]MDH2367780.1 fimbrial protein [Providencia rettgeri]QXB05686.1 fimbrial protein [Providencia rettgeri]SUC33179.1 putative minor fimbrial subunit StfF [Providencia rettgeri]HEM7131418.1 fimbrial protein [Providencia rettgeri]
MKNSSINNKIQYQICCFLLIFLANITYANWGFDGSLIIPPKCRLSHSDPIKVSFGKVGVNKVDGIHYKEKIPYELICDGDLTQPWNISLTLSGIAAGAGFDDATLQVKSDQNGNNVGIQIQKDGQPITLNKAFVIDQKTLPALSAVIVKKTGTKLIGDTFNATATLTITFQ